MFWDPTVCLECATVAMEQAFSKISFHDIVNNSVFLFSNHVSCLGGRMCVFLSYFGEPTPTKFMVHTTFLLALLPIYFKLLEMMV